MLDIRGIVVSKIWVFLSLRELQYRWEVASGNKTLELIRTAQPLVFGMFNAEYMLCRITGGASYIL